MKRVVKAKLADEVTEVPTAELVVEEAQIDQHQGVFVQVEQSEVQYENYMTVGGDGESVDAQPIGIKGPEIVDWDTILDGRKEHLKITRKDGNQEGFSSLIRLLKYSFRQDLDEIFAVGMKKYADRIF